MTALLKLSECLNDGNTSPPLSKLKHLEWLPNAPLNNRLWMVNIIWNPIDQVFQCSFCKEEMVTASNTALYEGGNRTSSLLCSPTFEDVVTHLKHTLCESAKGKVLSLVQYLRTLLSPWEASDEREMELVLQISATGTISLCDSSALASSCNLGSKCWSFWPLNPYMTCHIA